METYNEQIASRMGWEITDIEYSPTEFYDPETCKSFNLHDWDCVKAIQAQLVREGWMVYVYAHTTGGFEAGATNKQYIYTDILNSEPVAIVALACKVWRLK